MSIITIDSAFVLSFSSLSTGFISWLPLLAAALTALAGRIPLFEVNTGAIARGYRTTPYPDPFLLGQLSPACILFFISFIAVCLTGAARVLDARRFSEGGAA